ncbi:MAG: VOC family protein [Acidobacteriaceae bacterium]
MTENETAVQVESLAQVALTVTDLEAAKAFYRDALGMQFLFDAGTMAFFQCSNVRLLLGMAGETQPGGGTIVYFKVADLATAHTALLARGVTFKQDPHLVARMKSHDLWLAFVLDPAGNVLGLMEERQRLAGSV